MAGWRRTYAIQPSSLSSTLRWTPSRAATSRATKVVLLLIMITWSQCSGSVTFLYLSSSNWQRTGNCGVWRSPWVWRISQQHLNKQLVIVALADMPQLRQQQLHTQRYTFQLPSKPKVTSFLCNFPSAFAWICASYQIFPKLYML